MAGVVQNLLTLATGNLDSAVRGLGKDGADWKGARSQLATAREFTQDTLERYKKKKTKRKLTLKKLTDAIKDIKQICADHDADKKDIIMAYSALHDAIQLIEAELKADAKS